VGERFSRLYDCLVIQELLLLLTNARGVTQ
jgi:hypothetical protein